MKLSPENPSSFSTTSPLMPIRKEDCTETTFSQTHSTKDEKINKFAIAVFALGFFVVASVVAGAVLIPLALPAVVTIVAIIGIGLTVSAVAGTSLLITDAIKISMLKKEKKLLSEPANLPSPYLSGSLKTPNIALQNLETPELDYEITKAELARKESLAQIQNKSVKLKALTDSYINHLLMIANKHDVQVNVQNYNTDPSKTLSANLQLQRTNLEELDEVIEDVKSEIITINLVPKGMQVSSPNDRIKDDLVQLQLIQKSLQYIMMEENSFKFRSEEFKTLFTSSKETQPLFNEFRTIITEKNIATIAELENIQIN